MKKFAIGLILGIIMTLLLSVLYREININFGYSLGLVSREEILRIPSPDSMVDAVLMRTDGGATTSFGYYLFIVPAGREPEFGYESFIADHLVGEQIRWREPKFLEIQFDEARIFHFKNFWYSKDVQNFRYIVELNLKPTNPLSSLNPEDRKIE